MDLQSSIVGLASIPALGALLMALMQFLKGTFEPKYVPIITVGLGVVLAVLVGIALNQVHGLPDLAGYTLFGVNVALASVGIYESSIDKAQAAPKA